MNLSDLVTIERSNLGLTLSQLSASCGLSIMYLSEIERGLKTPRVTETLKRLSEGLIVPYETVKAALLESISIELEE